MSNNYWSKFRQARISRRHAIATTGSLTAAAAFLAACGSDEGSTTTGAATGTGTGATGGTGGTDDRGIYSPSDSTSTATQGGAIRHWAADDITHFDALASNSASTVNNGSVFAYNRLLRFAPGIYPNVADGTTEPEMAESFEPSPDQLTITLKIRQGPFTRWDERAPTNGREMDMDDVLFSWSKFAEVNPGGANLSNDRNPSSPVEFVEATDDSTLVLHLARPDATIISLLADTGGTMYIMPRESDGEFDPATDVRGNGPWLLEEHVPSVRFVWRRNPNYYREGRPFPDRLERPIVSEYAQRLAQFRTGNITTDVVQATQQDVIQLKLDAPQANLLLPNSYSPTLSPSIWFGYEGDSPFKDERVRQAFSMLVDREAFADALFNADVFEAEGLGVESRYNTCITAGWGPYWLDPLGSDFGENAKFLQYNAEEANALLAAAGHEGGLSTTVFFNSEGQYGPLYARARDVLTGFFTNENISVTQTPVQYAEFLNNYYFGYRSGATTQGGGGDKDGYNGYSIQAERPYPSAVNLMLGSWHSNGGAFHGLSPDGNNAFGGDPDLDAMIERIQREFDQDSQIAQTHDVIRYMTGRSYFIPAPVVRRNYELWWPSTRNLGLKERWAANNAFWAEQAIDYWVDTTQPPFA